MAECPVCGFEGYDRDDGCEKCGHVDEFRAKRKLKRNRRAEWYLDLR